MLERLRPELEELFASYGIAPEEAGGIVLDYLVILGARKRWIRDPDSWLLSALRERCEARLEERVLDQTDWEN